LKEKDIDVNARDVKERTALIRGCRAGSADGVRYLLHHAKKLDVLATDKFNRGAWDYQETLAIRVVLAHNIRNPNFVQKLSLREEDFESPEYLREEVMVHTKFQDQFTISMLLKIFDNNPDLVNAAYDRVVYGNGGNLNKLKEVVMKQLFIRGRRTEYSLNTSKFIAEPLNKTYSKNIPYKKLGGRPKKLDITNSPIFRQSTRTTWL